MANKLITCPVCGAEMASSAKVCPKCGAKNKKPFYKKWWFYALVVIVAFSAIAGAGGSGSSGSSGTRSASSSGGTTDSKAEVTPEEPVSYTHYNVTELFDALEGNAMKAESTYKDQYVELEGFLGNIDSSGKYIGVGAASDNYSYMFKSVQCYIKTDEQREQIMEMNRDDPIVVRGKIIRVGEVMGYSLNIDSIN